MLTLVINCVMLRCTITPNLRIQLILLPIYIPYCQHHTLLYLSVRILAEHYSELYHLMQCQCSFMAPCSTVTFQRRLLRVRRTAAHLQWKAIPLVTQQRQRTLVVVIFSTPL